MNTVLFFWSPYTATPKRYKSNIVTIYCELFCISVNVAISTATPIAGITEIVLVHHDHYATLVMVDGKYKQNVHTRV